MATDAPNTGAPARALAFPNLDPLDDISVMLEAANGACGILGEYLSNIATGGSDEAKAAYAIGYLLDAVRTKSGNLHSELARWRSAQMAGR